MPHLKLTGPLDLAALWHAPPAFRFSIPEEDTHFKYRESFRASGREAVLLRYVVTEGRLTQHVQVLVVADGDGFLVKADRGCPILRSPGVKLLLACVGQHLVLRHGMTVVKSNLGAFQERAAFWAAHGIPAASLSAEAIDEA